MQKGEKRFGPDSEDEEPEINPANVGTPAQTATPRQPGAIPGQTGTDSSQHALWSYLEGKISPQDLAAARAKFDPDTGKELGADNPNDLPGGLMPTPGGGLRPNVRSRPAQDRMLAADAKIAADKKRGGFLPWCRPHPIASVWNQTRPATARFANIKRHAASRPRLRRQRTSLRSTSAFPA